MKQKTNTILKTALSLIFVAALMFTFVKPAEAAMTSHDKYHPVTLGPGQIAEGFASNAQKDFYSITLTQDSAVKFTIEAPEIMSLAYMDENGSSYKDIKRGEEVQLLQKGTYILEVYTGYKPNPDVFYKVKYEVEAYDCGKAEITWKDGSNVGVVGQEKEFTIKYTPGKNFGRPNGSMLEEVAGTMIAGNKDSFTGTLAAGKPGYYNIPVKMYYLRGPVLFRKVVNFEYAARPAAPTDYNLIRGSHKSFTFGSSFAARNGDEIYLQRYAGGGKWVNAAKYDNSYGSTQKYFSAGGLKGNKTYTFRMIGAVPAANGKPALYSDPSGSFKLRTASAVKPVIKSVKISKLKTRKVPKKWVGGHWNSNHDWVSGHYEKGYKYLSFNVKVTLKKKIPGAVYLSTQDGYTPVAKYAKSKGGKVFNYTFKAAYKKRGKYIPIRVRTTTKNKSIAGPVSKTKKVKVR